MCHCPQRTAQPCTLYPAALPFAVLAQRAVPWECAANKEHRQLLQWFATVIFWLDIQMTAAIAVNSLLRMNGNSRLTHVPAMHITECFEMTNGRRWSCLCKWTPCSATTGTHLCTTSNCWKWSLLEHALCFLHGRLHRQAQTPSRQKVSAFS